jgi:hypothetical protein
MKNNESKSQEELTDEKLLLLLEAHKDEWPDNALEGGVFQLIKHISNESKK